MRRQTDLFEACMPEDRLHSAFRALRDSAIHREVRLLMNELYAHMGDPNGNFVKDFQSDGFHSHLFELACFAYLEESKFRIDRPVPSPDFLATAENGARLAVEATTANPPTGRTTDISLRSLADLPPKEIAAKVAHEFPRRMEAIFRRKLVHNYHERPHCQGAPLVLMVAPFFEAGSTTYVDESLLKLLYGVGDDSGTTAFFDLPETVQISGVLYCNAFTVSRFLRIATNWESENVVASREGFCYHDDDEGALHGFRFRMGAPETPRETWAEGVTLFTNPNAMNPLSKAVLPCTCTFSVEESTVVREIYGFHPVVSSMMIYVGGSEVAAIADK